MNIARRFFLKLIPLLAWRGDGSDPQALIRQLYTSPTPNGGYLQITAGAELVIEHFNSRGKRLYRSVK